MRKLAVSVLILLTLTGCAPPRVIDDPNPINDHKAAVPANGVIIDPPRPHGIPADFLFISLLVLIHDDRSIIRDRTADVIIDAESQVPGASVHGGYPYRIFTHTPYTHTVWYQPGLTISVSVNAEAEPGLDHNWSIECLAHDAAGDVELIGDTLDPVECFGSITIGG